MPSGECKQRSFRHGWCLISAARPASPRLVDELVWVGYDAIRPQPRWTTEIISARRFTARARASGEALGRAGHQGLVKIYPGAKGIKCAGRSDALILDDRSRSDTCPTMAIDETDVQVTHGGDRGQGLGRAAVLSHEPRDQPE